MKLNCIQTVGKLSVFINANWRKTGPGSRIWLKRQVFWPSPLKFCFADSSFFIIKKAGMKRSPCMNGILAPMKALHVMVLCLILAGLFCKVHNKRWL